MINRVVVFLKSLDEKGLLYLLIGITFGLRLYAVLMAKGIAYDSAGYGFIARDFLKGDFFKGLSFSFHPFYPLLISLVSFDTTHVEIAGRFLSLFFGTLTLIPIFFLAKETGGQRVSFLSGLFYAFHPYLVTYSGMLLSEATYWGLLTLSIYFFWMGLMRGKVLRVIVSGVFLALAYLTRPEGIGYLIFFLIWVMIYGGIKRGWFKKLALIGALILTLFFLTVPYLIYIHREAGQWFVSKKALETQSQFLKWGEKADHPSKGLEKQNSLENNSILLRIVHNIIQYIPFTTYHYLRAYHFTLWLFLFFGIIRKRQKFLKGELFFASLVLFHLFSLSTFTNSTIRYSVPLIPVTLFWAGEGVLEIQRVLTKIRVAKPEKWVSVFIILIILVQLPQSLRPERRHREEQKRVGLWLKQNTPKGAVIMSNSPIEAFYADREFIALPPGISISENLGRSYKEILLFAKKEGARYILVNKDTSEFNPEFVQSIHSSELKEFYRYKGKEEKLIIIYEVVY
jgi:hypothetical protein